MGSEWRECRREDIAAPSRNALVGGPFGSDLVSSDYVPRGVPVIRGENVSLGRWVAGDFAFVSEQKADRLAANTAGPLDLVFTQRGANHYRQVALVAAEAPDRCVISQSQMKLTVDPRSADPLFIYYLMRAPEQQAYLQRNAIQTGVPHTNLSILRRMPIRIPPLSQQRRIAAVLGALDDKIELSRRMSQTLESMARALFKSWFVDFDPVRAKAAGRDPGLPLKIADLFPDSFEDSELGEIPKGWRLGTIGLIADVVDCSHAKKPDRRENGRLLLQLTNIRSDGVLDTSDKYLIDAADYEAWTVRIEASPGDCVITNVGRVGAVAQIPAGVTAALGRNMTAVRCRRDWAYPTFLVEALRCGAMLDEISRKTDAGTILDALNVRSIPSLRVVVPSQGVLAGFDAAARPLRAAMESVEQQRGSLQNLRDALLHILVSGQLPTSTEAYGAVRAAS